MMFGEVFNTIVTRIDAYDDNGYSSYTYEEAFEKLQTTLNEEIKIVSDELAKELVTKGKWTSPRFKAAEDDLYPIYEKENHFAYYNDRDLVDLDIPN